MNNNLKDKLDTTKFFTKLIELFTKLIEFYNKNKLPLDIVAFIVSSSFVWQVAVPYIHEAISHDKEIKDAYNALEFGQGKQEKFGLTKPLEILVKYEKSLADRDLNGAILDPEIKLNKATLTQTKLNRATLIKAKLNRAKMDGAELVSAKLTRADMSNANLDHANLQRAEIDLAILTNATFNHADLRGADLRKAKLNDAKFNGAVIGCLDGICTNFKGAKSIKVEQIKESKNWTQACYDEDFIKNNKLQLPAPPKNQECAGDDE
jgi:hypothetical protein